MFDLLHSSFRDLALPQQRALGLLDEAVKHDDALANECAEEHTGYAFGTL
jgi:hypothetical protein